MISNENFYTRKRSSALKKDIDPLRHLNKKRKIHKPETKS